MNGTPISVRDFIVNRTRRESQIRKYRIYGMFLYKYFEKAIIDADMLICPICRREYPSRRTLTMHLIGDTKCSHELMRMIDKALYIWERFKRTCRKLYNKDRNKLYMLLTKYQPHEVYIMCEKDEYPEQP